MPYEYEILPRAAAVGGGWRLRLLDSGEEVGGGIFPAIADDPRTGMAWWNNLTTDERQHWLKAASLPTAADAYRAYLLVMAYADAEAEAYKWLDSRYK
jgi:hypothetical protein